MKKTIIILLSIALALVMLICGMLAYSYIRDTNASKWDEQYNLGIRYLRDGQYQEAVLAFTAAIDIAPRKYEAYIARGDAYIELDNYQAAQQDYQQAIVLAPDCHQEVAPKLDQVQIVIETHHQSDISQPRTVQDELIQPDTVPDEPTQPETEPTVNIEENKKHISKIIRYDSGAAELAAAFQYSHDGKLLEYLENTNDGYGHDFQINSHYFYDDAGNPIRKEYQGLFTAIYEYYYTEGLLSGYKETFTSGDGIDEPISTMYYLERNAAGNIVRSYYESENGNSHGSKDLSYDAYGRRIRESALHFYGGDTQNPGSSALVTVYDYTYHGLILEAMEGFSLDGSHPVSLFPYINMELELLPSYVLGGVCSFETDSEGYLISARDNQGQLIASFEYQDFSYGEDPWSEPPDIDYRLAYSDILDSFADLLERGPEEHSQTEGEAGAAELRRFLSPEEASQGLGYAIQDISGDGIPELIISPIGQQEMATSFGTTIYAVYTCNDGIPSLTFAGWSRNRYDLLFDGSIRNEGSNGAMYSCNSINRLSQDGTELVCQDIYFTDVSDMGAPDTIVYYHNTDGVWDKSYAGNIQLIKDQYYEEIRRLTQISSQPIELTPFSQYQPSH